LNGPTYDKLPILAQYTNMSDICWKIKLMVDVNEVLLDQLLEHRKFYLQN